MLKIYALCGAGLQKNHLKNSDQLMTEYISIKASIVGRNFGNYVYILQTQKFQ